MEGLNMTIQQMTIGIDIDATLTEAYYWIPWANAHFHRNLKPEDATEYDIHKVLGISEEAYLAFYDEYGEALHAASPIRREAPDVLHRLSSNHRLHYITARDPRMQRVTEEWLQHYGVPRDGLHLLGSHHKVSKAHQLGCRLFIEDRYENAVEIAASGIDVLLMDCHYNRISPLPDNIQRVSNWYEVERAVRIKEKNAA
jgi:uncharacterized HAD superfamily protein